MSTPYPEFEPPEMSNQLCPVCEAKGRMRCSEHRPKSLTSTSGGLTQQMKPRGFLNRIRRTKR